MMLLKLLAAFILIPLIELLLLLRLADMTSVMMTLAVVIVTGVIGSIMARREGVMAWYRFRSALAEGRMPGREIQDGLMIVFSAALLLTPGLLTDAVGFLLLTPTGRDYARRYFVKRYRDSIDVNVQVHSSGDRCSRPQTSNFESHQWSGRSAPNRHPETIDAKSYRRN